jgi:hypothetical protein
MTGRSCSSPSEGAADADGAALGQGDAAITQDRVKIATEGFLFAARLRGQ